jgi:hypothetical protein
VAAALEARGWRTSAGVGASERVIDLAVLDPDEPGRFLAGIEGDGGSYEEAATAVDREVLRPQVLAGLGWEIFRVWAPQWLKDPEGEASRLDAALRAALERRRAWQGQSGVSAESGGPRADSESGKDIPQAEGPAPEAVSEALAEAVRDAVRDLSPVPARILCREAARRLGQLPGRDLCKRILDFGRKEFKRTSDDAGPPPRSGGEIEFFWEGEPGEVAAFRKRRPGGEGDAEAFDVYEVAFPELVALAAETAPGPGEDPVELMGAALGLSRLGSASRARLRDAWMKAAGRVGSRAASGRGGIAGEEARP